MDTQNQRRNERLLQEAPDRGFISEFWDFLRTSKKWWILPILTVLLLFGLLLVMSNTAVAPFIYTLF